MNVPLYDKAKKYIGFGLLACAVASFVGGALGGTVATILGFISLLGFCVYMWGCGEYAKAKGHEGYVGLLGLFFPIGFIVLVWVVKDKSPQLAAPT